MHAYALCQLAALVAIHSRAILASRCRFPEAALEVYWTASRSRIDGWAKALKVQATVSTDYPADYRAYSLGGCEPILTEILASEVLTRIWTAICQGMDQRNGMAEAGPVAASVLSGHLEARHRVLGLMVYGYGLGVEAAVELNRQRLKHERWTDLLLSLLTDVDTHASLAFEPERVSQWAQMHASRRSAVNAGLETSLALATMQASYRQAGIAPAPHAELNRRIACSIVGCLPAAIFDSCGSFVSARQLSLSVDGHDAQGTLNLSPQEKPRAETDDTGDGWIGGYRSGWKRP